MTDIFIPFYETTIYENSVTIYVEIDKLNKIEL